MAEKVKKRSGKREKFSKHKLLHSIHHAMHMAGISDIALEERIAGDVINRLKKKKVVDTEDIRKTACYALRKDKYHRVCDYYGLVWLHAKPVNIKGVIKRDGRKEKFSPEKLFKSVQKTFKLAGMKDGLKLQKVMQDILSIIGKKYKGGYVSAENMKEIAEYVLVRRKLYGAAKRYIQYRYM